MADLKLPDDLAAFLKAGRQLEYDPASCEAGLVTLLVASAGRLPFAPDLDPAATKSFRELLRLLRAALPHLDRHVLQARAELAVDFTVMALADRAVTEAAGPAPRLSRKRFVAEVVRATAGILGTPA